MTENKINLQRYAMHFGTYMGLYWIVKFIPFPSTLASPLLFFLYMAMTLAVPFIGYYFACTFRDKTCGGEISFLQSWAFMALMYLFASLLAAVAHYIYFRYMDHGYMIDTIAEAVKSMELEKTPETEPFFELMKESVRLFRSLSPIEITMQTLSQNMLSCCILSLITAPFVMKKKKSVS